MLSPLIAANAQQINLPPPISAEDDDSELHRAPAPGDPAAQPDTLQTHDISAGREAAIARNLLTPTRKLRCDEQSADGGIVVCGKNEENERQRLPIPGDLPSAHAVNDGMLRAPNLFGIKPGTVSIRGCFLPPCPGPIMPMIDVTALPKAPPGSDADRIAKGEIRAP